jgi:hypothetical protein
MNSALRRTTAVLAVLLPALALPAAAHARSVAVDDPTGDATVEQLDFTRVKLSNHDDRIVATAHFVEAVRGDVIISVDPRGHRGLRLVSDYRPEGTTRNYVVPGAFTDSAGRRAPRAVDGIDCAGYQVRWNADKDRVRLVLPSTCLRGGDYGAVRFAFLSEDDGSDSDWGPETADGNVGSSSWIPRG